MMATPPNKLLRLPRLLSLLTLFPLLPVFTLLLTNLHCLDYLDCLHCFQCLNTVYTVPCIRRVIFRLRVEISRVKAKNYQFCEICRIQARVSTKYPES